MKHILGIFLLLTLAASSRPISYPGGWTLTQFNNWETSLLNVHYSPASTDSIGLFIENFNDEDRLNIDFSWHHLLGRRDTQKSQANLYLLTHAGVSLLDETEAFNGTIAIAGDWETRRYFTSYRTAFRYVDGVDNGSFHQVARLGVAPYLGEYGSIHTWLMLQVEHHPEQPSSEDRLILTPLVRIFKGDYLVELGVNSNGDALANLIIRF